MVVFLFVERWDDKMKFGYDFGEQCTENKGKIINSWTTGDDECDAESREYECGGIYNHNYMDVVGDRDHDCFWDCSECKRNQIKNFKQGE